MNQERIKKMIKDMTNVVILNEYREHRKTKRMKFKEDRKKIVFVSSPLKAYGLYTIEDNIMQASQFCREVVMTGNVPIAPHVYFTQFLDDSNPYERQLGFTSGIELLKMCSEMNCYILNGYVSGGMNKEIEIANELGIKINNIYLARE